MSTLKKLSFLFLFVLFTYCSAWVKVYFQSSDYYEYAQQQKDSGNLTYALKGMNKLELRIEDKYSGGYQQVIETWESSLVGLKPDFYEKALEESKLVIPLLTEEQLLSFIEIYVQLDTRYVPDAALELLNRSKMNGNTKLAQEMDEFLKEAFPDYQYQS
ncbi:hypothetical protein L4D76_09790 [Photobacterium sagamiensis]|uniref:hypothetical protein n=1 Tax=Photobacterium sagamiensis TaxID=2910241 RepID=UPI003D13B03C